MKIGIQTRPWGPDMNRNGLALILSEIAAIGYDGFEIGAQHLDLSEPNSLHYQASSNALSVVGIHVGGEIHDPQSVQAALDNLKQIVVFAKAAGAAFIPFSGRLKENKTSQELSAQAESLNKIGHICAESGLKLCYHNHFWEIDNDCAELYFLCEHTDPDLVSLCLDVGWIARAGASPVDVVDRFFDRIAYFHIKDTTADEWMEVGYGVVDFPALMAVIGRRQDWWLVVEQDEVRRQPVESARMSWDYLRQLLENE